MLDVCHTHATVYESNDHQMYSNIRIKSKYVQQVWHIGKWGKIINCALATTTMI
jgi:endonuclease IV